MAAATLRFGEIKVQGLPTGGNRPVEIAPRAADPDIGLIHPPGTGLPVGYLPVPPSVLIQLRGVFLHPAVDRGVIDWHTPLGHHFFEIAVAHPVAAVPPHRPQDDVTGKCRPEKMPMAVIISRRSFYCPNFATAPPVL